MTSSAVAAQLKRAPFAGRGRPVIDDGLWGFEITDADGYVLAFFRVRNE
jgi:hypothetical protein